MRGGSARWFTALAATVVLAACGSSETKPVGVGGEGGAGGTGAGGTGGGGGEGGVALPGPEVTALERIGAQLLGPQRAVLPARAGHLDLFGLEAIDVVPEEVGVLDLPTGAHGRAVVGGGLAVLDRRNGTVRTFGVAEGVPEVPVLDGSGAVVGNGAATVFDLAWLEPDERFVGATGEGVVRGNIAADGSVALTFATVPAPGGAGEARVLWVDAAGGEVLAGTASGVAVLDPTTLAVVRWADVGTVEGQAVTWGLLAAELDGLAVVAAIVGTAERPGHVAVIDGATVHSLAFDGFPVSLGAMPGALVVGVVEPDGRGSLQAIRRGPEGPFVEPLVAAHGLTNGSADPIVPAALVYDAVKNELLVGGGLPAGEPSLSGGFFRVVLDPGQPLDPVVEPIVLDAVDRRAAEGRLLPRGVHDMALDPSGALYVIGLDPSAEGPAEAGLLRWTLVEDEEGRASARVVRPFVSGVHTVTVDPNGDTWLGLGDELGAFGAPPRNYVLSSGACRLLADGSCQLHVPLVNAAPERGTDGLPDTLFHVAPAPVAPEVSFGTASRRETAILGVGGDLFVRRFDVTRGVDAAGLQVGRFGTRTAWDTSGGLWIASPMEWSRDCADDACQDGRPHGLVHVRFDGEARPTALRRFVRRAADTGFDVPGMPSNTAHAVLPLPGESHALVALGSEREVRASLHHQPPVSPDGIRGGLVEVEGTELRPIAPPEGIVFGDVVDLVLASDGRILALDTLEGIVEVDLETRTARRWAEAAWPAEERPTSLAVDGSGRVAVSTTAGVWAYGPEAGVSRVVGAEHGHVWRVRFVADGVLYAGADRGLLRIALDGAAMPPPGRPGPLPRDPWELSVGCGGAGDCWCDAEVDCVPGLVCECNEDSSDCRCVSPPPPECNGEESCPCTESSECLGANPECVCFADAGCYCYGDLTTCGGGEGCLCTEQTPCAEGFTCEQGFCTAPPPCEWTCGCETPTGCPEGWDRIEETPGDPSTCRCSLPFGCNWDCSCPTETRCPPGQTCNEELGECVRMGY